MGEFTDLDLLISMDTGRYVTRGDIFLYNMFFRRPKTIVLGWGGGNRYHSRSDSEGLGEIEKGAGLEEIWKEE